MEEQSMQSIWANVAADDRARRLLANGASFVLSAAAALALAISASFYDSFTSTNLALVLVVILFLQSQIQSRIFFSRECWMYGLFVVYMFVQLAWAPNVFLAFNTLVPAVNFVIIMMLFGSLVSYHSPRAVFFGILSGLTTAALIYSVISGFPLRYPTWFSYNAMSVFYLFGLFVALLLAAIQRSKLPFLFLGIIFMSLIVATTSIKTNLGIALGAAAAFLLYFGYFSRVLAKHSVLLLLLVMSLGYGIASNQTLVDNLQRGTDRIALGIEILQTRESIPGYGGFESRSKWFLQGIRGWAQSPVFGHGVEAFRSDAGMTSHSTPIDLLYNSGLIGFSLFYGLFLSLLWRFQVRNTHEQIPVLALIFATLVCFSFITLSGTMHYNTFLAAFFSISVAVLNRFRSDSGAGSNLLLGN